MIFLGTTIWKYGVYYSTLKIVMIIVVSIICFMITSSVVLTGNENKIIN
jgi:hypothetical protein